MTELVATDDRPPEQAMKPRVSGVLSKVRLDPYDLVERVRDRHARGSDDDDVPTPWILERLDVAEHARA